MKNQALFSSKDKSKKLKCRLLQFLFGALRVNSGLNAHICQESLSEINVQCELLLKERTCSSYI